MSVDTDTETQHVAPRPAANALPTAPCSVVWSGGHAYVLEGFQGRPRWVGVDDRGRPQTLSCADLQRRGWTRTR
jgi:ABC-type bacteriocin/lantibiotic exporter with double-glycine peptidase domain